MTLDVFSLPIGPLVNEARQAVAQYERATSRWDRQYHITRAFNTALIAEDLLRDVKQNIPHAHDPAVHEAVLADFGPTVAGLIDLCRSFMVEFD